MPQSKNKTQIIKTNESRLSTQIKAGSQELQYMNRFTYLGSTIDELCSRIETIPREAQWCKRSGNRRIKSTIKLLPELTISVFVYARESWTLKNYSEESWIMENNVLRNHLMRILCRPHREWRSSRHDHAWNSLKTTVRKSVLKWYGHANDSSSVIPKGFASNKRRGRRQKWIKYADNATEWTGRLINCWNEDTKVWYDVSHTIGV